MSNEISIALDAMGGDSGLDVVVPAAISAVNQHPDVQIILVGDEAARDRLRFYSTKDGGTGIGLSIVQRIIIDHGGLLDISASRWGGAEFRIEFPIEKGIGDS